MGRLLKLNCRVKLQTLILIVTVQLSLGISSDFGTLYHNLLHDRKRELSGDEMTKIFDGSVSPTSFPFMVAIMNGEAEPGLVCGASLVDESHILTAGHCAATIQEILEGGREPEGWIGVQNLKNFTGLRVPIRGVTRHPNFKPRPILHNDLALATLKYPINLKQSGTEAICIGQGDYNEVNVTLIGFGNFDCFNGSHVLRIASGSAMKNSICELHGHKKKILESQLCAQLENPEHRQADQAPGDSGGPLFFQMTDGTFAQVGSVSYNYIRNGTKDAEGNYRDPCPNTKIPGIYTRVGLYKEFILSVAPNAKFCT